MKNKLDKNSITPLYLQLEKLLLELIEKDELKEGDIIPSENELSKTYFVSRMTAKKAIDNLTIKGLVERIKGKGTFVIGKKKIELPLNRLRGFTQKVKEVGLIPKNIVPILEKRKADKKIAELLEIEENEEVWYIERIRQIDDTPAVFEQSYIAVSILPKLTKEELLSSKFEYIREMGLEINDSDREISAEIPNDYIAAALRLKRNEPILLAECITYLKDGRVLEYSTIFYNQKKYRFKIYANSF